MNGKIANMDLVFSLLLVLGCLAGLARSAVLLPPKRAPRLADMGTLVLVGTLIGSRAGYVSLNWVYYTLHPGEIMQVWLGGLSGAGAVYGFVAAVILTAWLFGERALILADQLLPLGLSLAAAGWLAAWWGGSAYGAQMEAWYAVPARGETGVWVMRFPTQLLGAFLCLAWWAGVETYFQRLPAAGARAGTGLLGVGAILVGLSLTRVDPVPVWNGLRLDTWAGIGLVCLAVVVLGAAGAMHVMGRLQDSQGKKNA